MLVWKQRLLPFRSRALFRIEALRKDKKIGKSLECIVRFYFPNGTEGKYDSYRSTLEEILNVSNVEFVFVPQKEVITKCKESEDIEAWQKWAADIESWQSQVGLPNDP